MRMIFVNLPVKDLSASVRFYEGLGFSTNPQFTDETAACVVIHENIFVMLLTHAKFKDFITGEIADPKKATAVINCLSAASREEVEAFAGKARAAGAGPWKPAQDYGFMYGESFQDPDGHVWEVVWLDVEAMKAAQEGAPAAA